MHKELSQGCFLHHLHLAMLVMVLGPVDSATFTSTYTSAKEIRVLSS
jgi:hypothetical protein